MTPLELEAAGATLYGHNWKTPLARVLGVYVSTVKRWANGTMPISGPAEAAVRCLVESKRIRDELVGVS